MFEIDSKQPNYQIITKGRHFVKIRSFGAVTRHNNEIIITLAFTFQKTSIPFDVYFNVTQVCIGRLFFELKKIGLAGSLPKSLENDWPNLWEEMLKLSSTEIEIEITEEAGKRRASIVGFAAK